LSGSGNIGCGRGLFDSSALLKLSHQELAVEWAVA
jgi:hypothetical protein